MNIHIELFDILDFIYPPFKRNGLRITGSGQLCIMYFIQN